MNAPPRWKPVINTTRKLWTGRPFSFKWNNSSVWESTRYYDPMKHSHNKVLNLAMGCSQEVKTYRAMCSVRQCGFPYRDGQVLSVPTVWTPASCHPLFKAPQFCSTWPWLRCTEMPAKAFAAALAPLTADTLKSSELFLHNIHSAQRDVM